MVSRSLLLVQIFSDQATVRVDEVVLVGKKFDVFGDSISAYEDHKVFVPTCRLCGYFAAEVTVDVCMCRSHWYVFTDLLKSVIQIVDFRLMPATGYRLRVVVNDCERESICWSGIQVRCLPL